MNRNKEANQYDKIFKENIEELIIPFAEKLLNINPEKLREIPDNFRKKTRLSQTSRDF